MKLLLKVLKWILIIVVVLIIAAVSYLAYMGVFNKLEAKQAKTGPYTIAYEEYIGSYSLTGPIFEKITRSLKTDGIETSRGLGIYFDDPSKTPADKLKSHCGIIIEEKYLLKVRKLGKKYTVKKIKGTESIIVEFPIRNSMSYMIGAIKAYPLLMRYAKEKGLKLNVAMELYDMKNNVAYYIFGLKK